MATTLPEFNPDSIYKDLATGEYMIYYAGRWSTEAELRSQIDQRKGSLSAIAAAKQKENAR